MRNKKGFLLGNTTVNIVVAVLCIIFLIILGVKLYDMFSKRSDFQKATSELEKIQEVLNKIDDGKVTEDHFILGPKGWYLVTIESGEICEGDQFCLCLCSDKKCDKEKACTPYDKLVQIKKGTYDNPGPIDFYSPRWMGWCSERYYEIEEVPLTMRAAFIPGEVYVYQNKDKRLFIDQYNPTTPLLMKFSEKDNSIIWSFNQVTWYLPYSTKPKTSELIYEKDCQFLLDFYQGEFLYGLYDFRDNKEYVERAIISEGGHISDGVYVIYPNVKI